MEKQDLLVSLTIDHDYPGKHRVATRFFSLSRSFFFGPFFFRFLYPRTFFCIGVIVKSFHVGIFVKCVMQIKICK